MDEMDREYAKRRAYLDALPPPEATPEQVGLQVLEQAEWQIHGDSGAGTGSGGSVGKVTAVSVCGVKAFVRENVDLGAGGHFGMHSGQRMRVKETGYFPFGSDVLEVAAPAPALACVMDAVRRLDWMRRPVRTHGQFTVRWAEEHLRAAADGRLRLAPRSRSYP